MQQSRFSRALWCFSLSLFLIIILLPLLRKGMFLDGIIYAAIAKNLMLGQGTLWQPFYTITHFPEFYEHPPLAIYLQSLFFKWLGDGFAVERFYSFSMACGQLCLLAWYWLKKDELFLKSPIVKDELQKPPVEGASFSLPLLLLLWLLIPLNHMYSSNMLEGTLSLFTTLASLLLLIRLNSNISFWFQQWFVALLILTAFLCNGPTAFFPLAIPFVINICNEKFAFIKCIKEILILMFCTAFVFVTFYSVVPDALQNTRNYLDQQLLASIIGSRQPIYVGLKHLNIFILFFRAYWLISLFVLSCIVIASKIKGESISKNLLHALKNRRFLAFLVLALISSLPVGVSHRQAFSYILPSAPFFTLAMMHLCFKPFNVIAQALTARPGFLNYFFKLGAFCFAICLCSTLFLAKGYNRQQAMIKDISHLLHYLKNDEVISTSSTLYKQWYTEAYFARFSKINITPKTGMTYFLLLKNEPVPFNYHALNIPLNYYTLAVRD